MAKRLYSSENQLSDGSSIRGYSSAGALLTSCVADKLDNRSLDPDKQHIKAHAGIDIGDTFSDGHSCYISTVSKLG